MSRRTLLLITSTIAPSTALKNHVQFDPDQRRREYSAALAFYLQTCAGVVDQILYCDNSGADLTSLADLHATIPDGPELRLISYVSDVAPTRGKGRAEFELIARAMAEAAPDLTPDDAIWKLTGRLKLTNMRQMIETQPTAFALYADLRQIPMIGDLMGGNNWMDTRAFAFSPEGYHRFIHGTQEAKNSVVEQDLFARIHPQIGPGAGIVPRFARQPIFEGTSGGSGKNYTSPANRAKDTLRRIARRAAPGVWL